MQIRAEKLKSGTRLMRTGVCVCAKFPRKIVPHKILPSATSNEPKWGCRRVESSRHLLLMSERFTYTLHGAKRKVGITCPLLL